MSDRVFKTSVSMSRLKWNLMYHTAADETAITTLIICNITGNRALYTSYVHIPDYISLKDAIAHQRPIRGFKKHIVQGIIIPGNYQLWMYMPLQPLENQITVTAITTISKNT